MATVKKGVLRPSPEWWKHLRPFMKRQFWKSHRKYERKHVKKEIRDDKPL